MASGIDLGNAWLNVVPSFQGVQKSIAKELGGVDISGATRKWSSSIASTVGGAFTKAAKVGVAAFAAVGAAAATQLGAAVSRADTLNNFPKIMKNLGYSSDDASKQIQKMSDKLDGLPTTLDSIAGTAQKIAPLTDSLGEATDISLALNNALLAGGKSTDLQSNAMEQYTQMLSIGKVDMQAWRSMVSAMPGQMDQLSKSLLGSSANSMDLYSAMQDGTVSFDDFNDAVLKLNDEGLSGYASFSQQAVDATAGIGTALTNLKTRTVKALAGVIEAFGVEDLAKDINGLSEPIAQLGKDAAELVTSVKNGEGLTEFGEGLVTIAGGITALGVAGKGLESWDSISGALSVFDQLPGKASGALTSATSAVKSGGSGLVTSVYTLFNHDLREAAAVDGSVFAGATQRISNGLSELGQPFKSLGGKVAGWMTPFTSAISSNFELAKVKVGDGASRIFDGVKGVGGQISSKLDPILSPIKNLGGKISGALAPIKSGLGNVFGGLFDAVSGPLQSAFDGIGGMISKFFSPGNFLKFFGIGAIIGGLIVGIGALASQLDSEMIGQIQAVIEQLPGMITKVVSQISARMPELMSVGVEVIQTLIEAITTNAPAIISGAADILSNLVSGLGAALPTLIPAAVEMIITIVQGLLGALPQIISAALDLVSGLAQGIVAALPVLIAALPQIILSIVNTIVTALPQIINTGIEVLNALINGIVEAIPLLVAMLPTLINTIITVIINNLPLIINAGINLLVALINGILTALPQLVGAVPKIVLTIVSTLAQNFPRLVNAGIDAIKQLVTGLARAFPQVASKIGELPGIVVKGIGNAGSMLFDSGKKIIQGLIDGIKSMIGAAGDAIGGVVQNVRDFLPFSPAKKGPFSGSGWYNLPDSGRKIIGQFASGIDGSSLLIDRAMDNALAASTERTFNAKVGFSGAGSSALDAAAGGDVYVQNPFTGEYLLAKVDSRVGTGLSATASNSRLVRGGV